MASIAMMIGGAVVNVMAFLEVRSFFPALEEVQRKERDMTWPSKGSKLHMQTGPERGKKELISSTES